MTEFGDIGRRFLWRSLIALPFVSIGFILLLWGQKPSLVLLAVLGVSVLMGGLMIIVSPIAEWFGALFSLSIYPTDYFSKAQPAYSIPEALIKRGRYNEAMSAYEKIVDQYPNDLKAYSGMLEIALLHLNDPKLASLIYYNGMDKLKEEEDRAALVRLYKAIHSRIEPKPQWEQERIIRLPERKDELPEE